MRKAILSLVVFAVLIGLMSTAAIAQTHNVTFMINTATVPDTIVAASSVTVTGNRPAITDWGAGAAAANIGGDYWSATVALNQGDTVAYKFRVNGAWENNSTNADGIGSITDNRTLIVGTADTTLKVQYVNFTGSTQLQYRTPWTAVADTFINIWFRINMQGLTSKPFDKDVDTVGVRGDKKGGSFGSTEFGWSPTRYLTRETSGGGLTYDGTNFWSGRIKLEKSKVAAGDTVEYKFLIGYDWGRDEGSNRSFVIPTGEKDTTLYWGWYNNEKPIARDNADSVVIKWRANLTTAIQKGSFADGDTVVVEFGHYATADTAKNGTGITGPFRTTQLARQGLTNFYEATDTIYTISGEFLDYQYYLIKNNADVREYFFNFDYAGNVTAEAERRQVLVSAPNMTVRDTVASVTSGRRQPFFENQRKLTQGVAVKWIVDMRPAYYQILANDSLMDIQGSLHVKHVDTIAAWGVAINGPATGGWGTWNMQLVADTASKTKMWDDGTHTDAVSGDSLYTITINYTTTSTVGQVFKFGIGGGDNESSFGLNHLANIDDTNPTYTIEDQFGSINPNKYFAWDFNNKVPLITGVEETDVLPLVYELRQNYPNPFNPTTTIVYDLPMESAVSLKVYNLLGQVVTTLTEGKQNAGRHVVSFDASKMTTGVYFYQITAGNFVSTKKMVLVK